MTGSSNLVLGLYMTRSTNPVNVSDLRSRSRSFDSFEGQNENKNIFQSIDSRNIMYEYNSIFQ